MSELGDSFREWKDHRREQRDKYGAPCEGCIQNHPNRNPSILFKGQKCRWCGWKRPKNKTMPEEQ